MDAVREIDNNDDYNDGDVDVNNRNRNGAKGHDGCWKHVEEVYGRVGCKPVLAPATGD